MVSFNSLTSDDLNSFFNFPNTITDETVERSLVKVSHESPVLKDAVVKLNIVLGEPFSSSHETKIVESSRLAQTSLCIWSILNIHCERLLSLS